MANMYTDESFKLHASAADNSFTQVNLIETKPVKAHSDTTNLNGAKAVRAATPDSAILLVPIFSIMVWMIVASKLPGVWKEARNRIVSLNQLEPMPCRNCRFFVNNHYLKCAVQPSIVLTPQALKCSDYWPDHRPY